MLKKISALALPLKLCFASLLFSPSLYSTNTKIDILTEQISSTTDPDEQLALIAKLDAALAEQNGEPEIQAPPAIMPVVTSNKPTSDPRIAQLEKIKTELRTMHALMLKPEQWDARMQFDFAKIVDRDINKIDSAITYLTGPHELHMPINIKAFVEYLQAIKNIYLKLELITRDRSIIANAPLATPCNAFSYQNIVLEIYQKLNAWLDAAWQDEGAQTHLTNGTVTVIVRKAVAKKTFLESLRIPDLLGLVDPIKEAIKGSTPNALRVPNAVKEAVLRCKSLFKLLEVDLNSRLTTLTSEYIAGKQTVPPITIVNLTPEEKYVLQLLEDKTLLKQQIKKLTEVVTTIKQKRPELFDLFTKHQSMITTPSFGPFQKRLDLISSHLISQYLSLTNQFFITQEPLTPYFAYQMASLYAQLDCLKSTLSSGVWRLWILGIWAGGKPEINFFIERMMAIVTGIQTLMAEKPQGFMASITSGEWLKNISKVIQNPNGTFGIDVAGDMLKNRQFKDLQTAGLYALAFKAPDLFSKLLNYFKPALKKDELDYATTLSNHKNPSEFLVTFADKHPDLLTQVSATHPEILDLLALQLKKMVQQG